MTYLDLFFLWFVNLIIRCSVEHFGFEHIHILHRLEAFLKNEKLVVKAFFVFIWNSLAKKFFFFFSFLPGILHQSCFHRGQLTAAK